MERTKQAVMILACDRHSGEVARILDRQSVHDWVIIPAGQARRLGHLAYRSPDHERTCDVVFGFVDTPAADATLRLLEQEAHAGAVCADCATYTWEVKEVPMAQPAVCPVCQMTVDQSSAGAMIHEGLVYYFCCEDCRKRFIANPEAYTVRAGSPARTG